MSSVASPSALPAPTDRAVPAAARWAELLSAAGRGDEDSFEVLAHEVREVLRVHALQVLNNSDDADEVVQEVLLETWHHAHRYDPHLGRATTWLGQIVRHRCIDLIRQTAARRARETQAVTRCAVVDIDDTLERVLVLVDRDTIRDALHCLTGLQREAIILVYYDDMTIVQAAGKLDIPVPTLKSRLRDGIRRLRVTMDVASRTDQEGAV